MQTSVRDVLNRRSKSRFFTRRCCVSEKRSKVFTLLVLAGLMSVYTYLQISVLIQAYANPVRQINNVVLPVLNLPGIYICMPFVNLTDATWWSSRSAVENYLAVNAPNQGTNLLADPRTSMAPLLTLNNPSNPGVLTLTDCCKTTFLDFFVDCFTYGRTCPVPVRFLRNTDTMTGTYPFQSSTWSIKLQCIVVSPGVMFYSNADNLFIPYFLTTDNGVLARNMDWTVSNISASQYDPAYLWFSNNYVYWPHKFTMFSYQPIENATNAVQIFYGQNNLDSIIGGSQNRIRSDVGFGISSSYLQHFVYYDITGEQITSLTGWTTSYDLTVSALPWVSSPSVFGVSGRVQQQNMAWMRIHVTMAEQQTREAYNYTYLDLATTILSIIGSAAALVHIVVGPGDYDPKGMLNKVFYNDTPVLKHAATDLAAAASETKDLKSKKKQAKEASMNQSQPVHD